MKKSTISLLFITLLLSACNFFGKKDYDQQLKSPCVGINGSPCKHIPINDLWLNNYHINKTLA